MKNFILLFAITVALIGCSQNDEHFIKASFRDYAEKNFDEPKNFDEIVSVELLGKTGKDSLKAVYLNLKIMQEETDSIESKLLTSLIVTLNKMDVEARERVQKSSLEFLYCVGQRSFEEQGETMQEIKDNIAKLDSLPFITYKITYRIKVGDSRELRTIYACKHGDSVNFSEANDEALYSAQYIKVAAKLYEQIAKINSEFDVIGKLLDDIRDSGYTIKID